MGETTGIAWCDSTFNPWVGCSKVSPGCKNCYAEAFDRRVGGAPKHQRSDPSKPMLRWGPGAPRTRTSVAYWKQPLRWDKEAEKTGQRRRVFCASMADVFDEDVPHAWLDELQGLVVVTSHLDWLLLSKRPEAYRRWGGPWDDNVHLGVTVENQREADRRIPLLLAEVCAVRFLSCEPLLEPVDLSPYLKSGGIHQVIIGGESGPNARPFDLAWARSLIEQCARAKVPVFVKQLGPAPLTSSNDDKRHCGDMNLPTPFVMKMPDSHGADWTDWPEDLCLRQFPEVAR